MASSHDTPILIVGGGPTGLTLSMLLSRMGVESLLVEADPSTCDHPQAHVVNARSMEIFRSFGLEAAIRERALPAGFGGVRFVTSLAGDELAHAHPVTEGGRLQEILAASPTSLASCAQDQVEPLLAAKAEEGPGRIRYSTRLVGLEQDEDGVTATLESGGTRETLRARWLAGCDGAGSPTRKLLGIPMQGPEAIARIVGIYFHADLSDLLRERPAMLYWTIDAESPGIFINMDGKQRWTLHTAWNQEEKSLDEFTPERCAEIVRHAIGADVPVDVRSVQPWVMTAQLAERYREGRVLLAGDAAHRFPPTGGFGMNTGIQDAHNLAWKLAGVVQGWAPEALLDTYQTERRPVADANRDFSVRNAMGLAAVVGPGAVQQGQRLASGAVTLEALSAEVQTVLDREIAHFDPLARDLGFVYESGALAPDGSMAPEVADADRDYVANARPGARAPHLWIERDGERISTLDLFDDHFTLLTIPARADAWRKATAGSVPSVTVIAVGTDVSDPDRCFTSLYGIENGAALIRPDGHVAWRSERPVDDPKRTLQTILVQILRAR